MPGKPREIRIIFIEELRRLLRSRWYLISTAAVVVILIAAMIVVPMVVGDDSDGTDNLAREIAKIGFVDQSGSSGVSGPRQFVDTAQGLQAVACGDIEWLYVVPTDYFETGRVEQYGAFPGSFPSNPEGEAMFRALLTTSLLQGKVEPQIEQRVTDPAQYENYRVAADATVAPLPPMAESIGGFMVPVLFAGLLGIGLAVGAGTMVQSVSEEKQSRLAEVILLSASPFSVMAGKLLALASVGLVQAAVWIVATALTVPAMFEKIPSLGEFSISAGLWPVIAFCFIAGYLLVTALALFVAAIAPSVQEASGMGSWVSLVAFVPLWFSGFIMPHPDGTLAQVLSYLPFTASTGILVRLSSGGNMVGWQIAVALVGVVAAAAIVLWIATRVFRAAILMRGQSFSRRNVWAALRDGD